MLSVIFGLVGVVVGVLWLIGVGFFASAWRPFLDVLHGTVPPFLILVGAVAIAAGISSLKDNMEAKKEQVKHEEEKPAESEDASSEEEEQKEEI